MAFDLHQLNARQHAYQAAVDAWIQAIRAEEALASANHNETQLDQWEAAADRQQAARKTTEAAKKSYEDALREEFFGF